MGNEIGLEVRKGEFMLEKKGTKQMTLCGLSI